MIIYYLLYIPARRDTIGCIQKIPSSGILGPENPQKIFAATHKLQFIKKGRKRGKIRCYS